MDEMRLKLGTKIMRGIVAKLISMFIKKKYGCKIDIHFDELDITSFNGSTTAKLNVELKMNSEEFMNLMKTIGVDD